MQKSLLCDGVLFRKVFDSAAAEVQLRCGVPNVTAGQFELPGQGARPLNYRDALLAYFHNGPLAVKGEHMKCWLEIIGGQA